MVRLAAWELEVEARAGGFRSELWACAELDGAVHPAWDMAGVEAVCGCLAMVVALWAQEHAEA